MASLELFFFGHPHILRDGQPVVMPRRKLMALLVYLSVTGKPQPRTTLAALFWPKSSRGLASLRRHLSELKTAIGAEALVIDRHTVGLSQTAAIWSDVQTFHQNLAQLPIPFDFPDTASMVESRPVPAHKLPLLTAAVDLQRADFLEGFTLPDSQEFDDWQRDQTEFLRRGLIMALQQLAAGLAFIGDLAAAIPYARRWTSLDPLDETAHLTLMQLYAATGQPTACLHQYDRCVDLLAEALDVQPGPALTALRDDLVQGLATPTDAPSQPVSLPRPHNLPAAPTPFIGREGALADLDRLLRTPDVPLITILGPGGSGKTRLSLQVAREQLDGPETIFPQGVFFVPLAAWEDPEKIPDQVAITLRLPPQEGHPPRDLALDHLRDKALLLVLDNFEHVLAGAPFLTEILEIAPGVKILVTSRRRLDLRSETVFTLGGMPVPNWDLPDGEIAPAGAEAFSEASESGAVQLFINTARRSQPNFELVPADLVDIARLCRLVDGMPLAIELAAGWIPHLPLDTIAGEIGRHYSILESELRDVAPRHRSLRAVFDASWSLLSPPERTTLAQLAVFECPFQWEAAAEVSGASLRQLARFTNASLLWASGDGHYQFHNLQRQYALDRLSETPTQGQTTRSRHSAYFADRLNQLGADLRGTRQPLVFKTLDDLYPDIRAAWQWAVQEHSFAELENLMDCLWYFFHIRARFSEARTLFSASPGLPPADLSADGRRVACKMLIYQAYFATVMGDWEIGLQASTAAADLLRVENLMQDIGVAGTFLGLTRMALDDTFFGLEIGKESLAHARETGDSWVLATTLNILGGAHTLLGADDEAEIFLRESATWYGQTGDRWGLAHCIYYLGTVAHERGMLDQAAGHFRESLEISRDLGDPVKTMQALLMLGRLYRMLAAPTESRAAYQEAIDLARQLGDRTAQVNATTGLIILNVDQGRFEEAKQFLLETLLLDAGFNPLEEVSGAMVTLAGHEKQHKPRLAWHLIQYVLASGTAAPEVQEELARLKNQAEDQHPPTFDPATLAIDAARATLIQALKDSQP